MSNLIINIRFGSKHLQWERDEYFFKIVHNKSHDKRAADFMWFEVYAFFGWHS